MFDLLFVLPREEPSIIFWGGRGGQAKVGKIEAGYVWKKKGKAMWLEKDSSWAKALTRSVHKTILVFVTVLLSIVSLALIAKLIQPFCNLESYLTSYTPCQHRV